MAIVTKARAVAKHLRVSFLQSRFVSVGLCPTGYTRTQFSRNSLLQRTAELQYTRGVCIMLN